MIAFTNPLSVLALASAATAQYVLPAKYVPYIGGNVFQNDDPAIESYPFTYRHHFEPGKYGSYYY
jgi:hypothetical protein